MKTTPNTNQYQVTNGYQLVMENNPDYQNFCTQRSIMLEEQENVSYDFKWLCCINDILVSIS